MHASPSAGYQHPRLTAGGGGHLVGGEAVHGFIGALGHARPSTCLAPESRPAHADLLNPSPSRSSYSDSPALLLRHAAVGATRTNSAAVTERAS